MVNRKYSLREMALGAGFILLFLVVVTLYIWYQTESVQLGYKIGELENQVSNLKEEIKILEAKKAGLLSLQRVENVARNDLGLTDPKPEQVQYESQYLKTEKKVP